MELISKQDRSTFSGSSNRITTFKIMYKILKRYAHNTPNIARNRITTNHFQRSLPYLPAPIKLEKTLSRYLNQVKPVLSNDVYKQLELEANNFAERDGKKLDRMLREGYQNVELFGGSRYIQEMLSNRKSFLRQTPGIGVTKTLHSDNQLVRATKLLYAVTDVYKQLRNNTYPPLTFSTNKFSSSDVFGKLIKHTPELMRTHVALACGLVPCNMESFHHFFANSRVPGEKIDSFRRNSNSRNASIICNGNIYSFDLVKENGDVTCLAEIYNNLSCIKSMATKPSDIPIAALTVLPRAQWNKHRNVLLSDQHNAEMLKLVEESIVILCLDGKGQPERIENKSILLGEKCGDRWFDKTAQFIVDEDSLSSLMSESTETTAVIPAEIGLYVETRSTELPSFSLETSSQHSVREVNFNINDGIKRGIEIAKTDFDVFKRHFETTFFITPDIKRKEFTKRLISPDSIMHIATQSALVKIHGRPSLYRTPCYIPTFKNSYPEYIHGPTKQLINIVEMFHRDDKVGIDQLKSYSDAFYKEVYLVRTGACLYDEHLWALKDIADKIGKYNEFFNSVAYNVSLHSRLDCASVPPHPTAKSVTFFPQVEGNFAFGCLFHHDKLSGCVSSHRNEGICSEEFVSLFLDAVHKIQWCVTQQEAETALV